MFEGLKQFFRKRMPGMTPEIAAIQKHRLSMFYAFITWNTFGLILYVFMKEKYPKLNESTVLNINSCVYSRFYNILH